MSMAGWRPQKGPQKALIDCPVYEIFYGGARGGGKTDGVLGKYIIKAMRYGAGFNAVFFRRELPMLDDAIARSHEIYGPAGAKWHEQKKTWIFPGGGRLRFRPLERTQDAQKYQGQNISDICIEEAGNYPDIAPVARLHGVLRSASGTPTQMILTGNPGGPGQQWIKERFIDPAPRGMNVLRQTMPNGIVKKRVFIPAKVQDNKILLKNDPDYIGNLFMVGSEQLVRAWLDGDWNAVEGAYFDCWSDKIMIRPFTIPTHWTRFRSFDWGAAKPFSVGWWAISDGTVQHIPRGAMVRYREWYGKKSANEGLKLTAEEVAQGILKRQPEGEPIKYSVADPACWKVDGGPSIAERMMRVGVLFRPADNQRLAGWDQMRRRMKGDEDSGPMIYCFDTCADSIRTIPALQHDEVKPEDLDTNAEDHAADEWRYACMSRPMTTELPGKGRKLTDPITFQDVWQELEQKIQAEEDENRFY